VGVGWVGMHGNWEGRGMDENDREWVGMNGNAQEWMRTDRNPINSHLFPAIPIMRLDGNVRMRFFPLSSIQSPIKTEKNITLYQAA